MRENTDNVIIRLCKVLSVDDDQAGLRIKVRIEPDDADCKYIEDLPYVFPLLPKLIHINPKVGECVMVILQTQGQFKGNRFFIGPLTSQQYMLNYDPFNFSSRCLLAGRQFDKPLPDPKMNPDNNGSLPDREDIAIQGRQNCDVILKDNEIRLRCGFKKNPLAAAKNSLIFNKVDLGYIQMRYKKMKDNKGNEFASSINLVADRINLLSHDSRTFVDITDREELITDEAMLDILDKCHPLPYGDELIEFLTKLLNLIRNHTHPFSMQPPSFTTPDNDILSTDLTKMLSQSVRIN